MVFTKEMTTDLNCEEGHFDASSIHEALQQILQSKEFNGALQLQTLLRFIVEESIEGHEDELKERVIGMHVFGRRPDYETADDPIVRSRARQLRKRLEQYYENDETNTPAIKIVIPKGSYKPSFIFCPRTVCKNDLVCPEDEPHPSRSFPDVAAIEQPASASNAQQILPLPTSRSVAAFIGVGLVVILLVGCIVTLGIEKWHRSKLDLFWEPIFHGNKTVILYSGSTQVYLPISIYNYYCLTNQAGDCDKPAINGGPRLAANDATQPATALTLVPYRYVRSEVIETNLKIAQLLTSHHIRMESRVEPNLPFVDLNGTPVVLLGAYNNNWTLELTQELPYFFDRDGRIHERGGQGRAWSTPPANDEKIAQDYAIVARLLNTKAGGPAVIIAGVTACGTQAAADFATDAEQLQKLGSIPREALKDKNIELVVRTSLINCNPTSLDVVAQRAW
jgi:hypothetical protein